ncbi:MAG: PH domain-containing protein [Acidimicrobiales bacterium]
MTPLVYSARVIGILVVLAVVDVGDSRNQSGHSGNYTNLIIYAIIAVVALIGGWISWLVTRYRVEKGELRVDSGLLRRQSKRLRLDRLQSVDVVSPVVARIFGLSELRLTTGGSDHTSVRLRYLPATEAQQLRAELLGLAAGLGPGVAEAPERPLFVVQPGTLVASIFLSLLSGQILLLAIGPLAGALTASNGGSAGFAVGFGVGAPMLIVVINYVWRKLNAQWSFTVAQSPDGLRIRAGLLSTTAQTVPPGRIQALRIEQPFLWRPFGWAAVHINVAGVGRSQQSSRILLPVAPLSVARELVEYVLGGVQIDSVETIRPPKRAALCSPLWWRFMSAGSDDHIFVSRRGMFSPVIDIVPNARTQSVRLKAGPWQRLWGLVTLHLDSTRGPVRVKAAHRDAIEGRSMLDEQARRAQAARLSAGPDRWMAHQPAPQGKIPSV